MPNQPYQPNEQQVAEFMSFISDVLGMQPPSEEDDIHGFILKSPIGEMNIKIYDHIVEISLNGVRVVTLEGNMENQTFNVKGFDFQQPDTCDYEQIIHLGPSPQEKGISEMNEYIKLLQEKQNFVTLDVATSSKKDICIFVKSMAGEPDKNPFQTWLITNKGSVTQTIYNEARYIGSDVTLDSGLRIFNRTCQDF